MSELRASDPTLDAFAYPVIVHFGEPGMAHKVGSNGLEACETDDEPEDAYILDAREARWFAVPCRTCFPDAPPPGHVWSQYVLGRVEPAVAPFLVATPGLAWQIEVSNRGGDTAPEQTAGGKPPTKLGDRGGRATDVVSHTGSVTTEYSVSGTSTPTTPLARLRSVAEATVEAGPWHTADDLAHLDREDAEHIAAFDPPTVLALLDVAEAAARTEIVEHGPIVSVLGWSDLQRTLARLDEVAL